MSIYTEHYRTESLSCAQCTKQRWNRPSSAGENRR